MLGLCGGPWRWAPRSPASRGPDARGGPLASSLHFPVSGDPRLRGSTLYLWMRGVPISPRVQELRGSFLLFKELLDEAHGSVWWSMGCGGGEGELGPDLWELTK